MLSESLLSLAAIGEGSGCAAAAGGSSASATTASATCGDIEEDLRMALQILEQGGAGEDAGEARELLVASLTHDLPSLLLAHLGVLGFEARKAAMRFFAAVLKGGLQLNLRPEVVAYMRGHPEVAQLLFRSYGREEVAMHCGYMLRACTRYPELVAFLLEMRAAFELIDLARHDSFDVASDAFASMRELFLSHEEASASYLEAHFDTFFEHYNELLSAQDYTTQRQALKLLGDMLLSRHFVLIMVRYVTNVQYMQVIMTLLLDRSRQIQLGAFHIFKIFVANPNKPPLARKILCKNRDKLQRLLEGFACLREDDEGFVGDVRAVVQLLAALTPPPTGRLAEPTKNASHTESSLASAVVH
jgi:calcium binding protein 39